MVLQNKPTASCEMPHGCIKICSPPAYKVGNLVNATPAALASRPDIVTPLGFSLLYRASKASVLMLYATRNSGTCSNDSCERQETGLKRSFSKDQRLLGGNIQHTLLPRDAASCCSTGVLKVLSRLRGEHTILWRQHTQLTKLTCRHIATELTSNFVR